MPLDSVSWNDKPEPDGLRRLRRLERVIEGVPSRAMDFSCYVNHCGTSGCALGWAAISGEFQAEGMSVERKTWPALNGVSIGEDSGWPERFFGISRDEHAHLFASMMIDKAEFLRRLRSVISEKAEAHARETVL